MKQAAPDLNFSLKKTRKRAFLEQVNQVVSWSALDELIAPYYPEGKNGRLSFSLQTMLRVHIHSRHGSRCQIPCMEEAFFDTPLLREFAPLDEFARLPDESTIRRFGKTPSARHRLAKHKLAEQILVTVNEVLTQPGLLLKTGTVVNATLIAAPTSTENKGEARDPEMHSSKKGKQWHIGVDAESGLAHTVHGTSGHVSDIVEANSLLHGQESLAFGNAGYQGIEKRPDARADFAWYTAMRPG